MGTGGYTRLEEAAAKSIVTQIIVNMLFCGSLFPFIWTRVWQGCYAVRQQLLRLL